METDPSRNQDLMARREERFIERMVFGHRPALVLVFALLSLFFAVQTAKLRPDASFEKMIPVEHPFIKAMLGHLAELGASGTTIQIAVENTEGDIFDAGYLAVLRQITDEVFYIEGVDRNQLKSLWTPNVRWTEVTESGFEGGVVMPDTYDGSAASLEALRQNLLRSGQVGRLVADNFRSSIVEAPIFDRDPISGRALDYQAFSSELEHKIRDRFEQGNIRVRITGFAKIVGDLLEGVTAIFLFAVITVTVTAVLLFCYTRCLAATIAPLGCSMIAVIWQLGLLSTLGYGLNAYSILIPFLVFAIGVSHGVQVVNAVGVETSAGRSRLMAAKFAFRGLYIAGMAALLSDAVGFLTMMLIDIEVIQDLGVAASVGVAVILLTNLVLLPVLMSYLGICLRGRQHIEKRQQADPVLWRLLARCATPRVATLALLVAALGYTVGLVGGRDLRIGDLDPGAPELRPDSRYNIDSRFINDNYATSSDVLVVMVETRPDSCYLYPNLERIDRFTWSMENVPGVESAISLATVARQVMMGFNEGSLKWAELSRNQRALDTTFGMVPPQLVNADCSLAPVALFLEDHKAETLATVVREVKAFARDNDSDDIRFVLAAGNAGVEAATNEEIAKRANADPDTRLHRGRGAGVPEFPLVYRGDLHHGAARPDLGIVQCADGVAGYRRQGRDAAGDRARGRRRRGLCDLHLQPAAGFSAAGDESRASLFFDAAHHRCRGEPHRGGAGDRRRHLDLVADQVPGRYGRAADLHVPAEHARRTVVAARARLSSDQTGEDAGAGIEATPA